MQHERSLFAYSDYFAAFKLVLPTMEAREVADQLSDADDDAILSPLNLSDDVLDLLALSSDENAKKVAELLELSADDVARRKDAAIERFGLSGEWGVGGEES